jgi:hypothetical protein
VREKSTAHKLRKTKGKQKKYRQIRVKMEEFAIKGALGWKEAKRALDRGPLPLIEGKR